MTSTSFAGFILNNKAGNSVIKTVRGLVNKNNVSVRLFARNKNRTQYAKNDFQKKIFRQNLPVKFATHYGVYIYNNHKKAKHCSNNDIVYAKTVFEAVASAYSSLGNKVTP